LKFRKRLKNIVVKYRYTSTIFTSYIIGFTTTTGHRVNNLQPVEQEFKQLRETKRREPATPPADYRHDSTNSISRNTDRHQRTPKHIRSNSNESS